MALRQKYFPFSKADVKLLTILQGKSFTLKRGPTSKNIHTKHVQMTGFYIFYLVPSDTTTVPLCFLPILLFTVVS